MNAPGNMTDGMMSAGHSTLRSQLPLSRQTVHQVHQPHHLCLHLHFPAHNLLHDVRGGTQGGYVGSWGVGLHPPHPEPSHGDRQGGLDPLVVLQEDAQLPFQALPYCSVQLLQSALVGAGVNSSDRLGELQQPKSVLEEHILGVTTGATSSLTPSFQTRGIPLSSGSASSWSWHQTIDLTALRCSPLSGPCCLGMSMTCCRRSFFPPKSSVIKKPRVLLQSEDFSDNVLHHWEESQSKEQRG